MNLLNFSFNSLSPIHSGTFSKRSDVVSGRNPFRRDLEMINYEGDSEDDWEEEGEGMYVG